MRLPPSPCKDSEAGTIDHAGRSRPLEDPPVGWLSSPAIPFPVSIAPKTILTASPSPRPDILTRTIRDCRREAFETEARRGCSHVRPTQAYWQSVEEAEREPPRRATGSDAGAGIHQ